MEPCTEPDGNETLELYYGKDRPVSEYKHNIMVKLTGQCPWCLGEKVA